MAFACIGFFASVRTVCAASYILIAILLFLYYSPKPMLVKTPQTLVSIYRKNKKSFQLGEEITMNNDRIHRSTI